MRSLLALPTLLIGLSIFTFGQNQNEDSLVSVIDFRWERVRIPGEKIDNSSVPPVRAVINENKMRQRAAREQQPRGTFDPNEGTVDGRSAALEKSVQESRSAKTEDVNGFRYTANVRNDSDRKIEIVFWEYRFTEFANTANVVRRQFLCVVKTKPGDKQILSGVSILGPSETISAESLSDPNAKLFDEKILINRIEYADGAILQRREWKMSEVKSSVDKAASSPWGKEVCKML